MFQTKNPYPLAKKDRFVSRNIEDGGPGYIFVKTKLPNADTDSYERTCWNSDRITLPPSNDAEDADTNIKLNIFVVTPWVSSASWEEG